MNFSSITFLFVFLPFTLIGYYVINDKLKKLFLLAVSLLFYSFGAAQSLPILLTSICFNYVCAFLIDRYRHYKWAAKGIVVLSLVINVGLLFFVKYLSYTINVGNLLFHMDMHVPSVALPLGISFFTFSAISYVLDVYWETAKADKNLLNVAVYIAFFPKLISGPMMSWNSFETELNNTKCSLELFADGIKRFIIGLAKKLIIADVIAVAVDTVYNAPNLKELSVATVWLVAFCYGMQLYFDFSGYSDMAVGLGKMLGFNLDENFNYPFVSKSVTEFWNRWHMSLGTWIEHYIYTPLILSLSKKMRKSGKKLSVKHCDYIALFITWIIMGAWHGAGMKYIAYGLWVFVFIFQERLWQSYRRKRKKAKRPIKDNVFTARILPHVYFFIFAEVNYIIFRANSLRDAGQMMLSMLGLSGNPFADYQTEYLLWQYAVVLAVALVASLPILKKCKQFLSKYIYGMRFCKLVEMVAYPVLFLVAVAYAANGSYDSFIYFNF